MICLLYRDTLCLALAGKVEPIYTIQASINLKNARLEEVDNGKGEKPFFFLYYTQTYPNLGIQCHTAQFSWKLEFECDHQLYEFIMTACSAQEENDWRRHLSRCTTAEYQKGEADLSGFLALNIRSLGTIFGRPGQFMPFMNIVQGNAS